LLIETAYTLRDESRFWKRVDDVKMQFQNEVRKAEHSLEDFLEGYDLFVDNYEDFLEAKKILERRRRSIKIWKN